MKKYYLVKGLVQGVGYRNFVCQIALQYKIFGWVRNLKTKDVELLAFTDEQTHNKLYKELKKGPMKAQVEQVLIKDLGNLGANITKFEILETKERPCYDI